MSRSVEFALADGESAFGELTEFADAHGSVLLLHDRDSDLDSVRPFTRSLHTLLINTLLLDLPGCGLSGGDWWTHGGRAVQSALRLCAQRTEPVGVIAVGESCSMLLGLHPGPVTVLALVSPRVTSEQLATAAAWRHTPQIAMGDPDDAAVAASLDDLGRWVQAWSYRLTVHSGSETAGLSVTPHMTSSSAAFIAEQLAYAAPTVGRQPARVALGQAGRAVTPTTRVSES